MIAKRDAVGGKRPEVWKIYMLCQRPKDAISAQLIDDDKENIWSVRHFAPAYIRSEHIADNSCSNASVKSVLHIDQ